jgi:hypothetical protein
METVFMENSFEIPISRRDFMEMTGMEATEGIAANTAGEPGIVSAVADDRENGTIKYAGREIPVLY